MKNMYVKKSVFYGIFLFLFLSTVFANTFIVEYADWFNPNEPVQFGVMSVMSEPEFLVKTQLEHIMTGAIIESDLSFEELKNDPCFKRVIPNIPIYALLSESVPAIGVNNNIFGESTFTGKGVTVAIIDSGINYTHPDFGGCSTEVFLAGTCERVKGGWNFIANNNNPMDDHRHGTHVASIVGGNGTLKGVAPDVTFVAYKVLNSQGGGSLDDLLLAFERMLDPELDGGIPDIAVMSLGGSYLTADPLDFISQKVNDLVSQGIVAVIAAGNNGTQGNFTIATPGVARAGITVGSVNNAGILSSFSSRGPTSRFTIKPDFVAPGEWICAANFNPGIFGLSCAGSNLYVSLSGTSMATPHVAGVVALLLEKNSSYTPEEIKSILKISSTKLEGYDRNEQGFGLVNATAALSLETTPCVSVFHTESMDYEFEDTFSFNVTATCREELVNWSISYYNDGWVELQTNTTPVQNHTVQITSLFTPPGISLFRLTVRDAYFSVDDFTFLNKTYESSIPIISPSQNQIFNTSTVLINISTFDDIDTVWLYNISNISQKIMYTEPFNFTDLSDNIYSITFYANNSVGQTATTERVFIINSSSPNIDLFSPLNDSVVTNQTVFLAFNTSEPVLASYIINNQDIVHINEHFNSSFNETLILSDNFYNITLFVNDTAGTLVAKEIEFFIETESPRLTVLSPQNITYEEVIFNLTFFTSEPVTAWYNLNNNESNTTITSENNINFTEEKVFPLGQNNITIYVNDTFGNMNQSTIFFFINPDLIPPQIFIHSPLNQTYYEGVIILNITATDNRVLDSMWYFNGTENVTYTEPISLEFEAGSHTLFAYANDTSGNINQTNVTFFVNLENPSFTQIETSTNVTKLAYNIQGEFNRPIRSVNISSNGITRQITSFVNDSGFLNYTLPLQSYGEQNILLTFEDTVGKSNQTWINVTVGLNSSAIVQSSPVLNGTLENIFSTIPIQLRINGTESDITISNVSDTLSFVSNNIAVVEFVLSQTIQLPLVSIKSQNETNNAGLLVRGLPVSKTLRLNLTGNLNRYGAVCIKDQSIFDFSQITSTCSGANEIYRIPNSTSSTSGGITTQRSGSIVTISGISNSAVVQMCAEDWVFGSWSVCSLSGTQSRSPFDNNNCDTQFTKPANEIRSCTPPAQADTTQNNNPVNQNPAPTQNDVIQNSSTEDEEVIQISSDDAADVSVTRISDSDSRNQINDGESESSQISQISMDKAVENDTNKGNIARRFVIIGLSVILLGLVISLVFMHTRKKKFIYH